MDLDKKAIEILQDKLNEHKHRMAESLFGSTEEMVLDAIKQALTIPVVSQQRELLKVLEYTRQIKNNPKDIQLIVDKLYVENL